MIIDACLRISSLLTVSIPQNDRDPFSHGRQVAQGRVNGEAHSIHSVDYTGYAIN